MAIQFTNSFALELLEAIHNFSSDTINVALFNGSATLGISTTAYSSTNESTNGNGYTTGGQAITVAASYPLTNANNTACVAFNTATWTFSGTTAVRYALLYNASKSNRSIMVLDMGSEKQCSGTFSISFPANLDPLITIRVPVVS